MSMINYDTFLQWANEHFDYITTSDEEVKINSIFTDDNKNKLWCCPSKNAYHCWKTDKSGNLYELVSLVNKCSRKEAGKILGKRNEIRELEEKVDRFFNSKSDPKVRPPDQIALPTYTYLISNLSEDNHFRVRSETYMKTRLLSTEGMYVCVSGKYYNRIIIPYYGPTGALIYWNGRDISGGAVAKYSGPDDKVVGVGKRSVLWMKTWPSLGDKVYLTEGEFDAMSLCMAGFVAGACGGKNLHDEQISLIHLKDYQHLKSCRICIAFDNDKSGQEALHKIGNTLVSNGIEEVSYVTPPKGLKDWNEMLIRDGKNVLEAYVKQAEKRFDELAIKK